MDSFPDLPPALTPEQRALYFDRFVIDDTDFLAVSFDSIRNTLMRHRPAASNLIYNPMTGVISSVASRLGAGSASGEWHTVDETWQVNDHVVATYRRRHSGQAPTVQWGIAPQAFLTQIQPWTGNPQKRARGYSSGPHLSTVTRQHFKDYVGIILPFFESETEGSDNR